MSVSRAFRHLATPAWVVSRAFPQEALVQIEQAIGATERTHGGEIRFAVEGNLGARELWQGETARERALEVFAQLGVWDTEANNGVLIYVLWADHDVEIVADRGFNGKVSHEEWAAVCTHMEQRFKANDAVGAILQGVREVGELIARHFPQVDRNELADKPVVL